MNVVGIQSIVGPLLDATRTKKIRWESDPTGGFIAHAGENTLNVYQLEYPGGTELRIINKDGDAVDFLSSTDERYREMLEELHARARVNALGLDIIVNDILSHLNVSH